MLAGSGIPRSCWVIMQGSVSEHIIMHCSERERLNYNACSPGSSQGS